jgi:predicted DNA-binding transcriptional regulator AlpA
VTIHSSRGPSAAHEAVDTAHPSKRLLPLAEVLRRIPLSRSYWYECIASGEAPAPVKIGKRSLWLESEIGQWVDGLAARRDAA